MGILKARAFDVSTVVKPAAAPSLEKKNAHKARTSITFARNPKYPSIAAPPRESLDLYQVLRYPIMTESAVMAMEKENTLVFVVDARADKKMIRGALKGLLSVEARRVNTLVRPDGTKKAYVKLAPGYVVADVANKIGMI